MHLLPDITVLFQWLLFMAALLALHYGIFRPVLHRLKERRERQEGDRKKAEDLVGLAQAMLEECERRLLEAREAGNADRQAHLQEAEERERNIIRGARDEIQKMSEELEARLDREKLEASLALRQYAQRLSREVASKILERKIA